MASKSTLYYRSHPHARRVKNRKSAEINRRPEQIKRRTILNRENRRRKTYGNGDHLDLSHTRNGLVYKPERVNRGSTNDSVGDRRSRGRRRKRKATN